MELELVNKEWTHDLVKSCREQFRHRETINSQLWLWCDLMCITSSLYINTNTPSDISYSPRGLGLVLPAPPPHQKYFYNFQKHFQAVKDFILIYSSIQWCVGTVRLEECNILTSIIVFSRYSSICQFAAGLVWRISLMIVLIHLAPHTRQ